MLTWRVFAEPVTNTMGFQTVVMLSLMAETRMELKAFDDAEHEIFIIYLRTCDFDLGLI